MTKVTSTQSDNRFLAYFQEVRNEMRKVVWPTREEAINLTIVVLFITLLMTFILSGMDYVFGQILGFIIDAAGT